MNPNTLKQIADYYDGLATLFQQLAIDATGASVSAPPSQAAPAASAGHVGAAQGSTWSDGSPVDEPEEWQEFTPAPLPQRQQPDVLGECPVHQQPWSVKPAGVSKRTGKPYNAFWHCDVGRCDKKPDYGWVKANPPEAVAA